MDKADVELIKEKLEECLKFVTVENGFIYLSLRMTMIHVKEYLDDETGETVCIQEVKNKSID